MPRVLLLLVPTVCFIACDDERCESRESTFEKLYVTDRWDEDEYFLLRLFLEVSKNHRRRSSKIRCLDEGLSTDGKCLNDAQYVLGL